MTDLLYWFRSRFIPRYRFHVVDTGLPPGWHDVDERMLHACMALLCSYVEDEQGGESGFPNVAAGDGENDAEALAIYRWWKHERQPAHDCYDVELMAWYGAKDEYDFGALCALDNALAARDQEMLHRLIDIRGSLWA
jgi:hypothetical protein